MKQPTGGFTLVEILVVVSIIAVLALVGTVSYVEVLQNARDAKRAEELQSIAKVFALELVKTGQEYTCERGRKIEPGMGTNAADSIPDIGADSCVAAAEIEALMLEYFSEVPHDPLGPDNERFFYYYDRHSCGVDATGVDQPSKLILFAAMENRDNSNREEVCPKVDNPSNLDAGDNNDGYYNYNADLDVLNYPYVVEIKNL